MTNLFLLRHSYSSSEASNDFDRTLTEEGIKKCSKVAEILQNYNVDIIYSSNSLRTKQTVENILNHLNKTIEVKYEPSLYKTTAPEIVNFIDQESYENKNILLVAHNPAISQAALLIDHNLNNSEFYTEVNLGFSPASLALYKNKKLVSFWR
jgi:phosphohistidine phosphatase